MKQQRVQQRQPEVERRVYGVKAQPPTYWMLRGEDLDEVLDEQFGPTSYVRNELDASQTLVGRIITPAGERLAVYQEESP